MGMMATLVKALLALLWLVNHSALGFVLPASRISSSSSSTSFEISNSQGIALQRSPRPVSPLQSTFLTLADVDTMTLNWIGLAVGTMASFWVYLNDQTQEGKMGTSSTAGGSSPVVMASASTTLAPPPPVAAAAAAPKPVVSIAAKPAAKSAAAAAAVVVEAPKPAATKVMKETQKEIKQKLQQVGDTLQTTAAAAAAAVTPSESPVFTEPYSDKVKLSVKRKSRFVGKLTKKVFMPWKAWSDL